MNKLVGVLVSVGVIAAAGYGSWYAWDNGIVGSNPIAPTNDNFMRSIDLHFRAKTNYELPGSIMACMDVYTGNAAMMTGLQDLALIQSPGQVVYNIPLRTISGVRPEDADSLAGRLGVLKGVGLVTERDATRLNTAGNPVPFRQFIVTREGWLSSGRPNCFLIGKTKILSISSVGRVQPDPDGMKAYDVRYKVGYGPIAQWSEAPQFAGVYEHLRREFKEKEFSVRLYRGSKSWIPENIVGQNPKRDNPAFLKDVSELVPPMTEEAFTEAISAVKHKACLTIPATGDDAALLEKAYGGRISATYFDDTDILPQPAKHKAWRNRLDKLSEAGLFSKEMIIAEPDKNRPGGVRYTMNDKYSTYVDQLKPSCMDLGETTLDKIIVPPNFITALKEQKAPPNKITVEYRALFKISGKAWSRDVDLSGAPEAVAFLENGAGVIGHFEADGSKWRLQESNAKRDQYIQAQVIPHKPPEAPLSELMPKASAAAEVHIVSVLGKDGETIEVDVRKKEPMFVVLSSHENVSWKIMAKPGTNIRKVIVMGGGGLAPGGSDMVGVVKARQVLPFMKQELESGRGLGLASIDEMFGRRPDSWQMTQYGQKFVISQSGFIGEAPVATSQSPAAVPASAAAQAKAGQLAEGKCGIAKQVVNGQVVYSSSERCESMAKTQAKPTPPTKREPWWKSEQAPTSAGMRKIPVPSSAPYPRAAP